MNLGNFVIICDRENIFGNKHFTSCRHSELYQPSSRINPHWQILAILLNEEWFAIPHPKIHWERQTWPVWYPIGQCGIQLARFLNLTGPERYTGHCFKRTGGSQLAEHGATELQIQTSLGWFLLFKSNCQKIDITIKLKTVIQDTNQSRHRRYT